MSTHPGYLPVLLWSLVILASFWGWGEALRRLLNRREFDDLGWGLTMAWGMSVVLAIGGLLMAFHQARAPVLVLLVFLGVALAGVLYASPVKTITPKKREPLSIPLVILYACAALAFASSVNWPFQIDPNDDIVCYLAFPEKILQTGTLIDPFNIRRIGTFGGQALLQALVMVVGNERSGHVPDRGLAMLIIFGTLLRLTRGTPKSLTILRFLLLACLFIVPVPRINTGSHLTGSALILALLATLDRLPLTTSPLKNCRLFLLPGLLLAGIASLRVTYFLFATLTFAGFLLLAKYLETKKPKLTLRAALPPIAAGALATLLALLPWAAVLYQSNHTPFFPVFLGTANPELLSQGHKGGKIFDYFHGLAFLLTAEALVLIFFAILLPFAKKPPLAWAAIIFAIFVSWYISVAFGVTILTESYRYTFPILSASAFWLSAQTLVADPAGERHSSPPQPALCLALALAFLITLNLPNGGRELSAQAESLPVQLAGSQPLLNPVFTSSLRYLQRHTPAGSAILAAVDAPYGFDFNRNKIFLADVPGGSRFGDWPLRRGPEALRRYLLAHGIQFVMAADFDNAMLLYTRKHWTEHQRPEWFFKEVWGKYFLDFMDSVDALAKEDGRLIEKSGNVRLIDLRDK